jgi:PAS domain S-box-containing protein
MAGRNSDPGHRKRPSGPERPADGAVKQPARRAASRPAAGPRWASDPAGGAEPPCPGFAELARLSQAVTASLALDEVLERVTAAATELVPESSARIWVTQGDGLALAAEAGTLGSPGDGRKTRLAPGEGLTGHVARVRTPLVVDRVLDDPRAVNRDWMERQGVAAFVGLPLLVRDRLVGVLSVHVRGAHRFTCEEIEALSSFGAQAAIAINNARLFEETERQRRSAESLARMGRRLSETLDVPTVADRIVGGVAELFDAPYAVLRLLQADGSLVALASHGPAREHFPPGHVLPPGQGLAGRAVADRRAIGSADVLADADIPVDADVRRRVLASGVRAFAVAPLVARDRTIGILAVGNAPGREMSSADLVLLQTFGDQAALALENARLYQEAREARDVTASREAFVRNVVESLAEGLVVLDVAGRVVTCNRAMERIWGVAARDIEGRSYRQLFAGLAARLEEPVTRLLAGAIETFHLPGIERDGPEGTAVNLNLKGSLLREHGRPCGAALLVEDVSGAMALQRAARQAEKMAALGALSAGTAHEINNPIGIMTSRIELMLLDADTLPERLRDDLGVLHRNAQRVARITQRLLAFARPSLGQQAPVDVNHMVRDALALAETQLRRRGVVTVLDLEPALPPVLGDAHALQEVVLNLVGNAREAMSDGGELRVQTMTVPGRRDQVRLLIRDTGTGIPAEHLPRIFDPFFTTKDYGTGLGLSVSYGIVRDHHGTVDVQSEPGNGTTFVLTFPALRLEDHVPGDGSPGPVNVAAQA